MGCGAVSADCIYFSLALVGAGLVSAMSESAVLRVLGLSLGSGMLTWLGISAIRKVREIQAVPAGLARTAGGEQGGGGTPPRPVAGIYLLGLALTLANPMTIALWLSIAAGFAASDGALERPFLRVAGVFCGALSWVCFVAGLTAWARRWINPAMMRTVNLLSGLILVGYGIWFFARIFLDG
jgi:putative LysE/RhtB family amino acid efflux pump